MTKVREIASAIEEFAPLRLQESYDNAGLQVGDPDAEVSGILLCLDVTEDILEEAARRSCSMVVSHHPLIFRGLKSLTGADETQRLVLRALRDGIAVYSAHTNLDSTRSGVSCEMAGMLGVRNLRPLEPSAPDAPTGLGVVGDIEPAPKLAFLRKVKEKFGVRALRYSAGRRDILVAKRVALCGGSGASLIQQAIDAGADVYITGDIKYHDFTGYGDRILLADVGHYESELCSEHIFSRIIREAFPEMVVYFPESESNPIKIM